MTDVSDQREVALQTPEQEDFIESRTPSGRAYSKRRWTLARSTDLIEGVQPEPLVVTLAWIVVPLALGLLFAWWMVS